MITKQIPAAAILILASACGSKSDVEPSAPPEASIFGLAYTPYRLGDDPDAGRFPTLSEVTEDLDFLRGKTKSLLFYSSAATHGFDDHVRTAAAAPYDFNVIAAAYFNDPTQSWAAEVNQAELDGLIDLINSGVALDFGVVGVEAVLHNRLTPAELIDRMDLVRTATAGRDVDITTIETWSVWLDNPGLAENVGIIPVNIYAYWDGVGIDRAVDHTFERFEAVREKYPDHRVLISEAGWPSAGPVREGAVPSPENAEAFYRALIDRANEENVEVILFSFADEAWKDEGGVGGHWGIMTQEREPKYDGLLDQ